MISTQIGTKIFIPLQHSNINGYQPVLVPALITNLLEWVQKQQLRNEILIGHLTISCLND